MAEESAQQHMLGEHCSWADFVEDEDYFGYGSCIDVVENYFAVVDTDFDYYYCCYCCNNRYFLGNSDFGDIDHYGNVVANIVG